MRGPELIELRILLAALDEDDELVEALVAMMMRGERVKLKEAFHTVLREMERVWP